LPLPAAKAFLKEVFKIKTSSRRTTNQTRRKTTRSVLMKMTTRRTNFVSGWITGFRPYRGGGIASLASQGRFLGRSAKSGCKAGSCGRDRFIGFGKRKVYLFFG